MHLDRVDPQLDAQVNHCQNRQLSRPMGGIADITSTGFAESELNLSCLRHYVTNSMTLCILRMSTALSD